MRDQRPFDLSSVVPLDFDHDFYIGYGAGQRTCDTNAYLTPDAVVNVAVRRYLDMCGSINLSLRRFKAGFRRGYIDQRNGTAHPLPPNDVPDHYNQTNGH